MEWFDRRELCLCIVALVSASHLPLEADRGHHLPVSHMSHVSGKPLRERACVGWNLNGQPMSTVFSPTVHSSPLLICPLSVEHPRKPVDAQPWLSLVSILQTSPRSARRLQPQEAWNSHRGEAHHREALGCSSGEGAADTGLQFSALFSLTIALWATKQLNHHALFMAIIFSLT